MKKAFLQPWIESERGWGTRPDGFSLHVTEQDVVDYMKQYWAKMPDSVPDEYSRPVGDPYQVNLTIGVFKRIGGLAKRVCEFITTITQIGTKKRPFY